MSGFVELAKNGYSVVLDGIAMSKAPTGLQEALSFSVVELALMDAPVLQVKHGLVEVTSGGADREHARPAGHGYPCSPDQGGARGSLAGHTTGALQELHNREVRGRASSTVARGHR